MATLNLVNSSKLFNILYQKPSATLYNAANVTLGRIKKDYTFTGRQKNIKTTLSFAGGVGSGSLPAANHANYNEAVITRKKVYAVAEIEREAIKAADGNKGAFVAGTKEPVMKAVESFNRNLSRILFNDGTGSLGTGDNSTNLAGTGAYGSDPDGMGAGYDPFIVVVSAATWKEANFEEKDFINYASETSLLEIMEVIPATRTIKLCGTSTGLTAIIGAPVPGIFYMQGSKNNDPMGLKGVLDATTSTMYGINVQRRWQAFQKAAAGGGISPALMNELILGVTKKCDKAPNMIMTSYTQFRKIQDFMEDQKRYSLDPRSKELVGKVSFTGIEYMGPNGPIGIFYDRFVEEDRMYFLNDNFMFLHHAPGFGWFDDDGTVFLRKEASDDYQARYGGYLEFYTEPTFHGVLTGLAV